MSAVATAVVGAAVIGGVVAKNNSDNVASTQGNIANAQRDQQTADRRLALQYAQASPEELAQLQKSVALNDADIARKQKILDSSDPAIIEAGKQALNLIRGQEATTLGPLKTNIAKQEQALRSKLQAQLGAGYENTTAGIQALQAFNEQANGALASAQQNSLGQLLGVAQAQSSSGFTNQISQASSLGSLFGQQNNRQISAINGTPISSAGLGMAGDITSANGSAQFGTTLANAGSTLGTLYGTGYFNQNKTPVADTSKSYAPTAGTFETLDSGQRNA